MLFVCCPSFHPLAGKQREGSGQQEKKQGMKRAANSKQVHDRNTLECGVPSAVALLIASDIRMHPDENERKDQIARMESFAEGFAEGAAEAPREVAGGEAAWPV